MQLITLVLTNKIKTRDTDFLLYKTNLQLTL
jgi:hypothetical protein